MDGALEDGRGWEDMRAIRVVGNWTKVDGAPEDWVEAGTWGVEAKMQFSLLALEHCIQWTFIVKASFQVAVVTFLHFTKWLTRSSFEATTFGAIIVGCCMTVVKTDLVEVSVMSYKATTNSHNKTHSFPGTPLEQSKLGSPTLN